MASTDLEIRCERVPNDPCFAVITVNGIEVDRVPTLYSYLKKKAEYSESQRCRLFCCWTPCVFDIYETDHVVIMDLFRRLQDWKGPPVSKSDTIWFRAALMRILTVLPNPPPELRTRWTNADVQEVFQDLREISLHWHFIHFTKAWMVSGARACGGVLGKISEHDVIKTRQAIMKVIQSVLVFYADTSPDIWTDTKQNMKLHALRKLDEHKKEKDCS